MPGIAQKNVKKRKKHDFGIFYGHGTFVKMKTEILLVATFGAQLREENGNQVRKWTL